MMFLPNVGNKIYVLKTQEHKTFFPSNFETTLTSQEKKSNSFSFFLTHCQFPKETFLRELTQCQFPKERT